MTDANQEKEDEVLRRMLATKPTPHKRSTKDAEAKVTRPKNERVTPVTD